MSRGRLSGGGELPEIQQKVTLPAVSRDDCSTEFGTTITDTMVCAGATGVGACNGDSGGPLVDGSGTLVGTVSWGSGACNSLSVFGNVGALVDFLEANI
jgi:secreted trypsin-like serine protease